MYVSHTTYITITFINQVFTRSCIGHDPKFGRAPQCGALSYTQRRPTLHPHTRRLQSSRKKSETYSKLTLFIYFTYSPTVTRASTVNCGPSALLRCCWSPRSSWNCSRPSKDSHVYPHSGPSAETPKKREASELQVLQTM